MAQSLSKIYVHIVFTTKHLRNIISEEIREELQRYIVGCLVNEKSYVEEIYVNPNHLHALCTLPRTITVAQMISKMKTPSSRWLKEKGCLGFEWQDGYAAFSVSPSNISAVKKYIQDQPIHHKKTDLKDELRLFLQKYAVEFDERYVWD